MRELFSAAKVTNLEFVIGFGLDVDEYVVRLDVSVSDAFAVDVCETGKELVHELFYDDVSVWMNDIFFTRSLVELGQSNRHKVSH